jgi:hypothetical protein
LTRAFCAHFGELPVTVAPNAVRYSHKNLAIGATHMPFPSLSIFRLLLAICLSALACAAQAGPFVFNKAGDEVLDTSTGWVWMRCSLGQSWNGQTCVGSAQTFNSAKAAGRSHADWVMPSVAQLVSLRVCSAGEGKDSVTVQGQGGGTFKQKCADGSSNPTINTAVFPETLSGFWTSSSSAGRPSGAWIVDFNNGNVGAYNEREYSFRVRLVRARQVPGAESALTFVLGRTAPKQADFPPEVWAQGAALEQRMSAVTLSWMPKSAGNPLPLLPHSKTVDLQKLATDMKVLALSDIHKAPVLASGAVNLPRLTEPEREAFQPRPVSIPAKGEFETTAAFEARKQRAEQEALRADQEAKDRAEQTYQSALRAFNAEHLAFKQQQAQQEADNAAARAQAEARKTDLRAYRSALLQAWELVINANLGDPVLQNIAYDADRQVFTAQLLSSHGHLVGDVTAPVPLAQAPGFKADLLSGKIAPKVTFAYPSMRLDWAVIENSAQRSARFAAAQNSIDDLETLMQEFPNAPEVSAAKRRVIALIAQEFSGANSAFQLQSVLNKYPNAAEAPAARKRVEQLRLAEQRAEREAQEAARRAEREAQEAARRQRDWENSPQGQAQRQARQLCEAQKATCIASCPLDRVFTYSPDMACESRCRSVSCY